MGNMTPVIVGAIVVGGAAVALYNLVDTKDDPIHATTPQSAVVSPLVAPNTTSVPEPNAQLSKVVIRENEPFLGKDDAPVTIIEYASMTCPHCAQFHNQVMPIIKSEFVDKGIVRMVYRDFPLDRLALAAAVIARCAGDHRYFPFVNALYAAQDKWARDSDPMAALSRVALLGGMSQAQFDKCLKKDEMAKEILDQQLAADNSYGLRSTPTIIVNGDLYSGGLTVDQLRAVINSKLN